jgi:hypothetical protein
MEEKFFGQNQAYVGQFPWKVLWIGPRHILLSEIWQKLATKKITCNQFFFFWLKIAKFLQKIQTSHL